MLERAVILLGVSAALAVGATLRGTVVDARGGEALARVRVQLIGAGAEAMTDAQGRFLLPDIPPGTYSLNVETVGYRLARRQIMVAEEDVVADIVLSPDTFHRTDSVEVRAGAFDAVAVTSPTEQTLLSSEVKNLGTVLLDDPVRAVHNMPGVAANNDLYAQFSVRGAPYQRVGFYLDDILLHAPFHTIQNVSDAASVSILNTDMIDSMSLLSSAFPSRYADRSGAVVDVRTRDGNRKEYNWRGAVTLANVTGLAEGPLGRRGSWMASARKSYFQHLVSKFTDDPALAIGFLDFQGKLSYDLTQRQTVSLHVIDGTTEIDRTAPGRQYGVNSLVMARFQPTIARAGWRWTPGTTVVVNAAGAWMREDYSHLNRDDLVLGSGLYGEWVGTGSVSWHRTRGHQVETGWSTRRLRDDGLTVRFLTNTTTVRTRDQFQGDALRHGGYAQQTVSFGRLRFNTGMRWDRHDLLDHSAVSPHASAALRIASGTELHAAWGQYVQYPEVWMLRTAAGGLRLLPERSTHYLAAIEQRIGTLTRVRAEVFSRDDRDLIARPLFDPRLVNGRVVVPNDTRLFNSVRGYARGAQFVVQRRSANRITGWVGYTLLFTRQRDGVEDLAFPSADDQRHTVNTWLSYRLLPSLNLSAAYNYGSGIPIPGFVRRTAERQYAVTANRNQDTLGSYRRLDLRVNKSFTHERWKFTLYGEVLNVTNHRNVRVNSFDGVNARTGAAFISVLRVFPRIPGVGLMVEF